MSSPIAFQDLLRAKKQGRPLTQEEIQFWIDGVVKKTIPEYQTTALLTQIYWRGMNIEERSFLTRAMAKSGTSMDYSEFNTMRVDKHSTGGIGDKTSLIIAPLVASLGLLNPMVAGRGLGHTGGTIDKLEAIPGYNTALDFDQMKNSIKNVGAFIAGQTEQLAPADKVIYSLRDVTETVDEISLITASILSKKFAEDLGGLTLDVKCGTGAFMNTYEKAVDLGTSLIQTANKGGVNCQGVVTRMDYPLGIWSGNSCEVWECVLAMTPGSEYCKIVDNLKYNADVQGFVQLNENNRAQDIKEVLVYFTVVLTLNMLILAGEAPEDGLKRIKEHWSNGQALEKFKEIVKFQGGDYDQFIKNNQVILDNFEQQSNKKVYEYKAPVSGKIKSVHGQKIGLLLVALGAGRKVKTDKITMDVSLQWLVHPNQQIEKGQVIARVYHPDESIFDRIKIEAHFNEFIEYSEEQDFQDNLPLVYSIITKDSDSDKLKQLHKDL